MESAISSLYEVLIKNFTEESHHMMSIFDYYHNDFTFVPKLLISYVVFALGGYLSTYLLVVFYRVPHNLNLGEGKLADTHPKRTICMT